MAKGFDFKDLVAGASINQLAQLFELDRRTVADRLRDVKPVARRSQHPVYKISEVAPLMVYNYMTEDKLSETQRMQRADKEKDYWDAKLKEQKYLENMGDLWRTEKVIEVFADVFKTFREAVVVFIDQLEHESGLPHDTIVKTKQFGDGLLVEIRNKLLANKIDSSDDHVVVAKTNTAEDLSDLGLD